jgi:hypothetical protein
MPEPTPIPRRRRTVNVPERSHDEIYALVEQSAKQAEQAWQASAQIEAMLKHLTDAIGTESQDEYGKPVGTGIVGRLMRLERDVAHRFGKFDGWVKIATGAGMVLAFLAPVLWWLLGDRLGVLLK